MSYYNCWCTCGLKHEVEETRGHVLSERDKFKKEIARLREALIGLLELGRKDTSSSKYDNYYTDAKTAIELSKE